MDSSRQAQRARAVGSGILALASSYGSLKAECTKLTQRFCAKVTHPSVRLVHSALDSKSWGWLCCRVLLFLSVRRHAFEHATRALLQQPFAMQHLHDSRSAFGSMATHSQTSTLLDLCNSNIALCAQSAGVQLMPRTPAQALLAAILAACASRQLERSPMATRPSVSTGWHSMGSQPLDAA